MASIFSKIIAGEIPCEKVYESDRALAFMDIAPWVKGHTLVIPKAEAVRLQDLAAEDYQALMEALMAVCKAVSAANDGCDYNLLLNNGPDAGQEVPHVHFHVIPRPVGLPFDIKKRYKYDDGEMARFGEAIRKHIP